MRVGVTGSSGFVGSAVVADLKRWGYDVLRLVRSERLLAKDAALWNYERQLCDRKALERCDALIHLAGENIASGRWTESKKKRIRDSRVLGTRFLAKEVASLASPPAVCVCASAIGFYGNRGDEVCDEDTSPGQGFLSSVVQEWEKASLPMVEDGVRVVNLRIGLVLSKAGGALKRMLLPFRLGLGGVIGSGKQYMSWIAIDDLIGVIHHALTQEQLRGPLNAVAPEPVTNADFTRALGSALHRPTFLPMPERLVQLVFGEMGDELLLSSTRVSSARLSDSGCSFQAPTITSAFQQLL